MPRQKVDGKSCEIMGQADNRPAIFLKKKAFDEPVQIEGMV
jgi:hypothetical protein